MKFKKGCLHKIVVINIQDAFAEYTGLLPGALFVFFLLGSNRLLIALIILENLVGVLSSIFKVSECKWANHIQFKILRLMLPT